MSGISNSRRFLRTAHSNGALVSPPSQGAFEQAGPLEAGSSKSGLPTIPLDKRRLLGKPLLMSASLECAVLRAAAVGDAASNVRIVGMRGLDSSGACCLLCGEVFLLGPGRIRERKQAPWEWESDSTRAPTP